MTAARIAGAHGTLLIHAWLLVSMLIPPVPQKVPRPRPAEVPISPIASSDSEGDGIGCAKTYRGVGIEHNFTGYVRKVVAGGPADRAGIRVGDWLLNALVLNRDGYSVGRVIVLKVERDGVQIDVPVRIALICFEEVTP